MGSKPYLSHLFSWSIDLFVFQSNIMTDPFFLDLASRSMVPAIGRGRYGLNTIFSTPSISRPALNFSATFRPFSKTSFSFSFSA